MTEKPAAEVHAENIDVHLTENGKFAMLTIMNSTQGLSVTLPRPALESLQARIVAVLRGGAASAA
jgi:hypothetical protein